MDNAQFRLDFPEFTSTTVYPESQLTFWAGVAEKMLPLDTWGDMYTTAVKLYVAHELVIYRTNSQSAANSGSPGGFGGIAQSKAVGGVSVSYDSNNTSEKDAGYWNLTTYGKQLYRLMMIFGAGCKQL